jgi:hypothetical protein
MATHPAVISAGPAGSSAIRYQSAHWRGRAECLELADFVAKVVDGFLAE